MPSVIADPAVVKFIETVGNGASAAADSVAGLVLRLVGRVGALEKTVEAQGVRLKQIDKLARTKLAPVVVPLTPIMTGVDTATGAAVRVMPKRSRGRPRGSLDTYKRSPRGRYHEQQAEVSSNYVDPGWDDLSVG
jgi:hypothetical protein